MSNQNELSVTHFIPLVGPWSIAVKELNKTNEFKIEEKYFFSFPAFKNNEQHIFANYGTEIQYLPEDLISDYETPTWMYNETYRNYIKDNGIIKCDLQLSLPPCAGLSMLNNATRGADNAANRWMFESVKWYLAQDNDILLIENAPGLFSGKGNDVVNTIKKIIDINGKGDEICIHLIKTDTINHGIPQSRTRSFLYLYKKNLVNGFGIFKNLERQTPDVKDFLLRSNESDELIDHYPIKCVLDKSVMGLLYKTNSFDMYREIFNKYFETSGKESNIHLWPYVLEQYNQDKTYFDNVEDLEYRDWLIIKSKKNQAKLDDNKGYWDSSPIFPNKYFNAVISKSFFDMIHPTHNRILTYREAMDLMGFPEDFKIVDVEKNWNHICQNMPICTGMDQLRWVIGGLIQKNSKYLSNVINNEDVIIMKSNNLNKDIENNNLFFDKDHIEIPKRSVEKIDSSLTEMFF